MRSSLVTRITHYDEISTNPNLRKNDVNPQNDLHYWLNLLRVPGIGPKRFMSALHHFDTPQSVMNASLQTLKAKGVPQNVAKAIVNTDSNICKIDLQWLADSALHHIITIYDEAYPEQLKTINDPPPVLFAKGNIACLRDPQLAIVGSRNPTTGGRDNAHSFAKHLAGNGLTITSGLALGIDGFAHKGALDSLTSPTIAVTATGLDTTYPGKHQKLAEAIIESSGLIVSEHPIGTPVKAQFFPRRNRIISGISLGTLVVEAAIKSGSLITARNAMEQGREVFAIPGSIHNPLAKGCHRLIREGAKLVETADDILEELTPQLQLFLDHPLDKLSLHQPENNETPGADELSSDQRLILEAMGFDPVSIDKMVVQTGLTIEVVSSILLLLELHGHISACGGGRYVRLSKSVTL